MLCDTPVTHNICYELKTAAPGSCFLCDGSSAVLYTFVLSDAFQAINLLASLPVFNVWHNYTACYIEIHQKRAARALDGHKSDQQGQKLLIHSTDSLIRPLRPILFLFLPDDLPDSSFCQSNGPRYFRWLHFPAIFPDKLPYVLF